MLTPPKNLRFLLAAALAASAMPGCSAADFGGAGGTKATERPKAEAEPEAEPEPERTDADTDTPDDIDPESETGTPTDPTFAIDAQGMARQSFKANAKVDIVFVVDTSASMVQETKALRTNIPEFLAKFVEAAIIDFQIFVVGSKSWLKFENFIEHERVELVNKTVSSYDGLKMARSFFDGEIEPTKLALREDAVKELVFVSDDNGKNPNGTEFAAYLAGRADKVYVSGIVGLTKGGGVDCNIVNPGASYIELADMREHEGLIQDLCRQDWDRMLKDLSQTITRRVGLEFALKATPSNPKAIAVRVAGEPLSKADFSYDADENTVTIATAAAPKFGDHVIIAFPTTP